MTNPAIRGCYGLRLTGPEEKEARDRQGDTKEKEDQAIQGAGQLVGRKRGRGGTSPLPAPLSQDTAGSKRGKASGKQQPAVPAAAVALKGKKMKGKAEEGAARTTGAADTGMLVKRVEPLSSCSRVIQKGDVILTLNGVPVGNDGTIPFRNGERIASSYLFRYSISISHPLSSSSSLFA
jgi:hypothetical protein